jgi:hypothetical protein
VFKFDPPALHPFHELDPAQPDLPGPAVPVMGQSVIPDEIPDALLGHRRPAGNFPDCNVSFVFRYRCRGVHLEFRSIDIVLVRDSPRLNALGNSFIKCC